jgi:hypothetical protein
MFHVALLEPFRQSSRALRGAEEVQRALKGVEAMDLDDVDEQWEINEILGSSCDSEGKVKYLVKWKGYPDAED